MDNSNSENTNNSNSDQASGNKENKGDNKGDDNQSTTQTASNSATNQSANQSTGQSSTAQSTDIESLQQELENAKLKLQELTTISQRALADLQNFKRRSEEEKISFLNFSNAALIIDLLPALDNAHRALEHAPKDSQIQEWLNGVIATLNQFENILKEKGLKLIEALNQPFNPEYHEALITEEGPKDMIIRELEKGYLLNDKVLRRSKVSVGNGQITNEIKKD